MYEMSHNHHDREPKGFGFPVRFFGSTSGEDKSFRVRHPYTPDCILLKFLQD